MQCQGSGGQSPASHCEGPCSIPGQSMWDLWWAKLLSARFFSQYFGVPCQYHSTNASYSYSCCSYQKDKREKSDNVRISTGRPAVQIDTRKRWREQHFIATCHLDTTIAVPARLSVLLFRMWDVLGSHGLLHPQSSSEYIRSFPQSSRQWIQTSRTASFQVPLPLFMIIFPYFECCWPRQLNKRPPVNCNR